MSLDEADILVAPYFGIQIDGVTLEYVQQVTGLEQKQDVIEFKQNTPQGEVVTAKMPGVPQSGEIQVVRGASASPAFTKWLKDSFDGEMGSARKNATIIMMDYERNPVRRFNLRRAWCSGRSFSDLEAGGTSPVTETATIVYEEMRIEES
jgi:phage tail-like protein